MGNCSAADGQQAAYTFLFWTDVDGCKAVFVVLSDSGYRYSDCGLPAGDSYGCSGGVNSDLNIYISLCGLDQILCL